MLRLATTLLMALWLLGLMTGFTMSSFIHVLLVLAIVIELIRINDVEKNSSTEGLQIEE